MTVGEPAAWSAVRGRHLAAVAQHLGVRPGQALRVTMRDGTVHRGSHVGVYFDIVVLSTGWRTGMEIAASDVARIEQRRLRLDRAFGIGAAVLVLGALIGALHDARRQADPSSLHDSAFLGGLLGAMAAPFVVWLLQDLRAFHRWHTVFE